jgi:hypothetical protein
MMVRGRRAGEMLHPSHLWYARAEALEIGSSEAQSESQVRGCGEKLGAAGDNVLITGPEAGLGALSGTLGTWRCSKTPVAGLERQGHHLPAAAHGAPPGWPPR